MKILVAFSVKYNRRLELTRQGRTTKKLQNRHKREGEKPRSTVELWKVNPDYGRKIFVANLEGQTCFCSLDLDWGGSELLTSIELGQATERQGA